MNEVVISGLSIISGFGMTWEDHWKIWQKNKGKKIDENIKGKDYLSFPDINFSSYLEIEDDINRISKYTTLASKFLLNDANLKYPNKNIEQSGIILSSIGGCLEELVSFVKVLHQEGSFGVDPIHYSNTTANAPAAYMSIYLGMKGMNLSVFGDVVSGIDSTGLGYSFIKAGIHKGLLLTGGFEEYTPNCIEIWNNSKHTNYKLSEGIVLLCLENKEAAQKRKTKIYAKVKSYISCKCDSIERKKSTIKKVLNSINLNIQDIDKIFCMGEGNFERCSHEENLIRDIFGKNKEVFNPAKTFGLWGCSSGTFLIALGAMDLYKNSHMNNNHDSEKNVLVISWSKNENYAAMILGK